METESQTHDAPRYSTLRDYLTVLRRNRLLITCVTVALAGASYAFSAVQTPTYVASSSVSFSDLLEDLRLISPGDTVPELPAPVRAAQNAELVDRPAVTKAVARRLDTERSPEALAALVTGIVTPQTNLVRIEARDSDAAFAARLANAFAQEVRAVGLRSARGDLRAAQRSLAAEIAELRDSTDPTSQFQLSVLQSSLARLRTLREIAEPVEIVQRAQTPGSPDTPRTTRNTVLGALFGLFLGLLLAFVRDSLDRRLRTVQAIHEELRMPVLSRVPTSALGTSGLAANGRRTLNNHDFEAFRMLRTNLAALGRNGVAPSAVLVTSATPQEGKTTVSVALACASALAGQQVLLVECDLRRPMIGSRLGIEPSPGLTEYLMGTASPREILQVVDLAAPAPTLTRSGDQPPAGAVETLACITAGAASNTASELLMGERFRDFLSKVRKAYDLVVLDSSPLLAVSDPLQLAPLVDAVLVCSRLEHTTREGARATRDALAQGSPKSLGAVVTGFRHGRQGGYDYYYYYTYA